MDGTIISWMIGNVPNCDEWILEFIKLNMFTIGALLGILKILAKETKCATDDKIVTLLTSIFSRNTNKINKSK